MTSELGCVTPWLVVPGAWSDKEITHHARQLSEGQWSRPLGAANECSCSWCHWLCSIHDSRWFVAQSCAPFPSLPAPLPSSVPATGLASNCSCNCLAPKVVLLAEGWAQAPAFVAAVKAELAQLPLPAPYYPGLRQRYQAFKEQYPQVLQAPFSLA